MSDLTQNLIPTGTLIGTLAVGAGTTDYNTLENKPSINSVTLAGNKTTSDLGLFSGDFNDLANKPNLSINNVTYTASKTSGAWVIKSIQGKSYGHVYQLMIQFQGTGTSVSAGDNAFLGNITSGTLPLLPAINSTFYYHTPIYLRVDEAGNIQVRIFNEALNFSSTDTVITSVIFLA